MSNIRVRIRNPEAIRARLRPVQSIRVGTTDTYLFDPDLILDSVEDARDWAIKTDGLVDEEDYSSKAWAIGGTGTETNNSKYWAEQSATSASNASTSETNAGLSATSASNSASTATTQAGIATTQAGIATTKAGEASSSASTATTQAGIATTKANDASTSATNASNSATSAGNSATIATTQAGIATTQAGLSKQWAIGEPTEPVEGSAKYWAEQASHSVAYDGQLDIQVNGSSIATFTANQSGNTTANIVVPTIPTVGDGTITITQGGVTKGTFTTNQSGNSTIALDAGGGSSYTAGTGIDITNDVISVTAPTLTNTATGSGGLTIKGFSSSATNATNVGVYSQATASQATAFGRQARATAQTSTALGASAITSADYAIQIGWGENSTQKTLNIGFYNGSPENATNYQLLDGITGLIPDARISSNIARVSDIPTTPTVDGVTIDTNSSDELEAIGVIDNNGNAIKTWTGTLAQYNAIVTKDSNTLYNITDDMSVTQTILETLYPVGSLYIGKMSTCPLASLIPNSTWTLVASDKVLQGSGTYTAGTSVNAGLPNITGSIALEDMAQAQSAADGAFSLDTTAGSGDYTGTNNYARQYFKANFSASSSSAIYGASNTVQPPAYVVNIWERTA